MNALNIDVVLGAIGSYFLASKTLAVSPAVHEWLLLGMAVWCIYVADRLNDVRHAPYAHTYRHRLYYKYRRQFMILCCGLIMVGVLVFWLTFQSPIMRAFAFVIAGLSAIHLFFTGGTAPVKSEARYPKEVPVALIYTLGIWGGPVLHSLPMPLHGYPALISFALAALVNLLLFSFNENHTDMKDGQKWSIYKILSKKAIQAIMIFFSFAGLFSAAVTFIYVKDAGVTLLLIHLVILLPVIFRNYFIKNHLYRFVADGAFSLSYLVLLI